MISLNRSRSQRDTQAQDLSASLSSACRYDVAIREVIELFNCLI